MPARQQHGFDYEQDVANRYGVILDNNHYTAMWDGMMNNIPVSIKTHKKGSGPELGSWHRQFTIDYDFYMIVGFWEGDKSNIVEEYCLFIPGKEYHSYFIDITEDVQNVFSSCSNDRKDDEKWQKMKNAVTKKWKTETPNIISLNWKRDHKKQKRLQCSIRKSVFYDEFVRRYNIDRNN